MQARRMIFGSALLMLTGCQTIGGEGMPTLTRTGEVKDIVIRETVEPTAVTVNSGDEVRWINKRQGDVRVIFLNPITENLACQRNFGGPMGFGTKRNEYSAKLGPNDTASVCFRDSGEVKYVVRAVSGDPIGEQNIAGVIQIGGERAAREFTRDKQEHRSAHQQPEQETATNR
jgi:plastocyanin